MRLSRIPPAGGRRRARGRNSRRGPAPRTAARDRARAPRPSQHVEVRTYRAPYADIDPVGDDDAVVVERRAAAGEAADVAVLVHELGHRAVPADPVDHRPAGQQIERRPLRELESPSRRYNSPSFARAGRGGEWARGLGDRELGVGSVGHACHPLQGQPQTVANAAQHEPQVVAAVVVPGDQPPARVPGPAGGVPGDRCRETSGGDRRRSVRRWPSGRGLAACQGRSRRKTA